MPNPVSFALRGEHITLDALLKATGLAGSGGAAKNLIATGDVRVDGEPETRRSRKIRPGQRVELGTACVCVEALPVPTDGSADTGERADTGAADA